MNPLLPGKRILLVTSNLGLTFPILRVLNRMGIRPYLLGPEGRSPLLRLSLFCHHYIAYAEGQFGYDNSHTISSFSEAFVDLVNTVCAREQIDVVLPVDFTVILPMSRHKDRLDPTIRLTPHLDEALLRRLNDKWQFSRLAAEHAIPQPDTRLLDGDARLDALDIRFPVIVKPLDRGGGVGIRRLDSLPALRDDLAATRHDLSEHPLLCQTYLPGQDLQVFVFAAGGRLLAWSMCLMERKGSRHFVTLPTVLEHCETLISAAGYDGPGLVDLRYDPDTGQIGFLEINVRFPASTYYHYLAGVNYVELALLAGLGEADRFRFQPAREQRISRGPWDTLLTKLHEFTTPIHDHG